jgi:hypothetical protein
MHILTALEYNHTYNLFKQSVISASKWADSNSSMTMSYRVQKKNQILPGGQILATYMLIPAHTYTYLHVLSMA